MGKRVNTTKKERLELCKRLGYTEEQMQKFWDECVEVNSKIKMLHNAGHNWTDLCVWQMEKLPTLKEETLKALAEKSRKETEELKQKEEAKKAAEYYNEHFKEIMFNKIINKEELTEHELSRLACDYSIEDSRGENRRWSRTVTSIVELNDRFFAIVWEEGLTEMQENSFYDQPYEVELNEYEKVQVIKVREWNRVD